MRIGPILEITTNFQHFKFGVEVRIQSVKEDNSQSWVRISYGTIRHVNNYIKYNTQSLASPQEEEAEPASSEVIAARSKAKATPQPRESSGMTTIPFNERIRIDIVPSKRDFDSHMVSKKVINLLRHNQNVNREEDGTKQFYKIQFHLRDHHPQIHIGLMIVGKLVWPQEEVRKEDINIALIILEQSFTSVLFKDILGAISLILHYKTTS